MKRKKMIAVKIKIGDLFKLLHIDNNIYDIDQHPLYNIYIKDLSNNLVPILGYVKKRVNLVNYKLKSRVSDREYNLTCSDKHLVINEYNETVKISETSSLQNLHDGILDIIEKNIIGEGDAYDIGIAPPHLYTTTNGIIHHNTTLTRILSKGYDTLTINCSAERGIDTIREKIMGFSSAISLLDGKENIKVIVLEECDGMTNDAFDSLRAVIEKFAGSVRFIGNCNNINKIPEPIQSRFNVIPCYPINAEEEKYLFEGYVNYVGQILNYIKCTYNDETLHHYMLKVFMN